MSNFIQWFKDPHNKNLFETNVIPLVSEFNGSIVGGSWKIMYQPWAFEMALSMSEAGVNRKLISWENHPEKPGKLFPVYNWSRIALVFGLYGKLLKTKWKGFLSPELRQQIIDDQERNYNTRLD